jgi:hypothetical protein
MEFFRKIFKISRNKRQEEPARGMAPVQSQDEQDQTRNRMEAEMARQKERRDATKPEA